MKFEFHNPPHLIFGAGTLLQLGKVARRHGKKALIVTGGGSIKRSGVFDRAVASLVALVDHDRAERSDRIRGL